MAVAEQRLTQPERVEAMRARLLDATVECLMAKGYSGLSTNDVVRAAGVSRGALAHHFPTRAELMAAAGERLIEQAAAEFRTTFLDLPAKRQTVADALDLLWTYYEGPTFLALLELIVAARTNPELRAVLADGPEILATATLDVFLELFPSSAHQPLAEQLMRAAVALLAGVALQTMVDGDPHGHHAATRQVLKQLAAALLPESGT